MRVSIRNATLVALWAVGFALATSGCALTSKAAVVDVRYFSPERVKPRLDNQDSNGPHPALVPALQLRMGRVSSGPNLRERIAYRNSAYELGYYEDLRWTERPETYVRREFARALFEMHAMHRVLTGAAPTLDVEVIAFDEVRLGANRAARIQLKIILYDDNGVIFEDTLTIDCPVAGQKPKIEDVIAAMATALDTAADQVALKVQKALANGHLATAPDLAPSIEAAR